MKNQLNTHNISRHFLKLALTLSLALPLPSLATSVTLASSPLANSSTTTVSPNMMFMLDDSGSMAWDYMPDNALNFSGYYGFESNHCNGVYYNPTITYTPPVTSTGVSYPNSAFTAAWNNGYNTGAGTVNLNTQFPGGSGSGNSGAPNYTGPAFYYTYSGTQSQNYQMQYQNTSSIFYKECISAVGSTTKVDGTNPVNTVFKLVSLTSTLPTSTITVLSPGGATITVNGNSNSKVSKILVNGAEILNATTSSSSNSTTLAGYIASAINNCTTAVTGNCTVTGYSATASSNVVTILGPASAGGFSPALTNSSGSMTYAYTAFPFIASTYVSGITVNGTQLLLSGNAPTGTTGTTSVNTLASSIATAINATGYSASASGNVVTVTGNSSSSNFTPVITTVPTSGGLTLTATQFPYTSPPSVLQNFANWYSYYSNRMLMMKTGVGLAFAPIGGNYRVGFMTMNNNVAPDYVDIAPFTAAQKSAWYTKLYASSAGNSTPLREALSHVGQLYAHKLGAYTTYTATITVSGNSSTVVNSLAVNGVEILAGNSTPSANSTTVATNVALQINIPVVSNYGAVSSGNVITITSGLASDVGSYPVELDDGGGMTFTVTPFVANSVTAQLNGVTPADPIQFSCQQNFVILSTDGYWNGSTTYDLDNNPVGNQDGIAPRPMYDGAAFTVTTSKTYQIQKQMTQTTSQLQKRTTQIQSSTSTLQSQTSQLQSSTSTLQSQTSQLQAKTSTLQVSTGQLQQATSVNSGGTWTAWSNVASCTWKTFGGSTRTKCQYLAMSAFSNAAGTCTVVDQSAQTSNGNVWNGNKTSCQYTAYTAWAGASACSAVAQSGSSPYTVLTATQCQTVVTSPYANAGSCTVNAVPNGSGNTTQCQYTGWSAGVGVSSCIAVAQSSAPNYTVGTSTKCQTVVTSAYANAPSCTVNAVPNGSGNTTQCQYTTWTAYANGPCTAQAQDAGPSYTHGTATQCQTTDTGWVGAASCTNSDTHLTNGQIVYCPSPNPVVTGPTPVLSCTAQTANAGNSYTAISCTPVYGSGGSTGTVVSSCTPVLASASNSYTAITCNSVQLSSTSSASSCTPGQTGSPSYITTTCTVGSGGTANTLADVAMYYYQTDLRDPSLSNCTGAPSTTYPSGTDVCPNNVFVTPQDNNTQQHLTTYTLGIGVRGAMVYTSPNYMSDTSGDFYSVKTGATADSTQTPPICSWQANGTVCNWPIPASNSYTNVDDLWHAAVDGHGIYYSAANPSALSTGLTSALSSITARKGAAAAAATSTLNPVAGNNYAYVASYTTVQWTGNLEARSINTITGVIAQTATWCAENIPADTCLAPGAIVASTSGNSTIYNCVTPNSSASSCASPGVFDSTANTCALQMAVACNGTLPPTVGPSSDTRTIYTANSTGTGLINFDATYATNNPANFSAAHINTLSQWAGLTTAQQALAPGVNLINYLRGQIGYDNRASNPVANQLYRSRLAVMGDALESQPSYIAAPTFSYADTGYGAFVAANINRPGAVYMGTNDGMLHAFNGSTGAENWTYVPSIVIPNMYKLADFNYGTQHVNYVNGSPIISDFYCTVNCAGGVTPAWRTILVGGLNGGGREYYALDITNPTAPALLWEFTPAQDANLGYTFGLPVVTKLSTGQWVVLVTSGYDNGTLSSDGVTANVPAGNGVGYLYVLDAQTGAIVKKISTAVGSAATPSGLAQISAWNTAPSSNQASYIYGGDLLGNLWRFDINAGAVFQMATLEDASFNPQPITTTPTLGQIDGERIVFVGTGEYLQTSDLSNTNVQSLYAISDTSTTTLSNPRSITKITGSSATGKMVQQTITQNGTVRTGTSNPVDFSVDRGWYIDFPDTGERENVGSDLIQGTLLVPTIVPSNTVCAPGGYGWLNFFDYLSGSPVAVSLTPNAPPNTNVSVQYSNSIVGMNVLYIGGTPIVEVVTSSDPTPTVNTSVAIAPTTSNFSGTRAQWRELIP
jgi:Tfp pilus tip-associated adhesin PilY1